MAIRKRKKGVQSHRLALFIPTDLQYILEYHSIQNGYLHTNASTLKNRPMTAAYIVDLLSHVVGLKKLSQVQRKQMSEYQNNINQQRALEDG